MIAGLIDKLSLNPFLKLENILLNTYLLSFNSVTRATLIVY